MTEKKQKPDWSRRFNHYDHRPDWQDFVPHLLYDLGDVFFPIPRKRKGWDYPHHMDDYTYCADSKVLNAYIEAGFGYGISCRGSTAVVDIDEKDYISSVSSKLPTTAYQVTGSREGVHLFYQAPGLNTRQILHRKDEKHDCDNEDHTCGYDDDGDCVKEWEWKHLGEVKCDPHGYVIGPGSVHPSGNRYGPLQGDKIAEVDGDDLIDSLSEFIKPSYSSAASVPEYSREEYQNSRYSFYELDADDVVPWLEPGAKVPHPVHGSSTGKNFEKMDDRGKFYCWRHDHGGSQGVAINPQQLLAIKETEMDCDVVRRRWKNDSRLHWKSWKRAVQDGLVNHRVIPYKALHGFAVENGMIDKSEKVEGKLYWDLVNIVRCSVERDWLPTSEPP